MKVVLGFDGGGTKTECVVLNEQGEFIARAKGPASNPTRIGFPAAAAGVAETADAALRWAASPIEIASVCAGLAGTADPVNHERMLRLLEEKFAGIPVDLRTDLDLSLAAMPPGPAIVLVAGTGSAAVGRDATNKQLREGGYGRFGSDEGSAFDIGCAAIAAARSGNSNEAEDLARQILRHLGAENWTDVDAAAGKNADNIFPRVFPVVAVAADAGNSLAQSLLNDAAEKLAAICVRLAEKLHLAQQIFPLAKVGGTVGRSKFLDTALDRNLAELLPTAAVSAPAIDSAAAAAKIAFQMFREHASAKR